MIACTQPHWVIPVGDTDGCVVAAWDDDGHPMIAGRRTLVRAASVFGDDYQVLSAADWDPQGIGQLVPCDDDGSQIAWALCNDGKVRAVFFSETDGNASAVDLNPGRIR